jgi:ankyrin repeat protein
VQAYYEEYKKMKDEYKESQFILYTNAPNGLKQTTDGTKKNEIDAIKFTIIEDFDHENDIVKLFDNSSQEGNVYKFEAKSNEGENDTVAPEYERFLSRLRLFVNQKNETDLEQDMIKILGEKTATQYIQFFRMWHKGRFEDKKIDKKTVNVHLIESFLSSCIITDRYFPVGQNEKFKLFEKVIKHFDVTVVNDSFKNFIKENLIYDFNLVEGIEEKLKTYKEQYNIEQNASTNDECIMRLAKEFKIIDKEVTKLENEVKLKVLHYVFEKPIIVNFSETSEELIYKIMELHQLGSKIKFILVGQGIKSARLSRFRIFENLNDLSINEILYKDVTRTCCLSLQGRKETTLEELIDSCEEIRKHIGAKEILQMLNGIFLIGQAKESIPSFYVNRKVSFKVKTIDEFLNYTFFMKHLAVVKFDRKVEKIQNEIRKCNINVVDVHDYLKSTQISNERTIISTNEECSTQLLQDVLKKSDNKSVVCLKISENNGFLIIFIEENQLPLLIRPVNIICADPGMGKTTMMKKLRNEYDSSFWTIEVDLKTQTEFFKTKHDANELLHHLIKGKENGLSKKIREVFLSKKKVYFFFDGLDEVENKCVDNVLYSVKKLSTEGFHVWIFSRKTFKTELKKLDNVAMDMEEIEEEQQKIYIENHLKEKYNHEQIKSIITKIFKSSNIDNNCQVLGKVLQLYTITQIFLNDKNLHQTMTEYTFIFTRMYDLFFRGRITHNQDKEESKFPLLPKALVDNILETHELLAVHSMFDKEVLEKLSVDLRSVLRFIDEFKKDKNIFGIVTKVNEEGKAVFEHFTYGEYFAARFLANNFEKARLIREELFSDGRKNLMMILSVILAENNPLHLAVIYRNEDQIAKYIDDKNVYDKARRNPLHLATFIEPRCVDRKSCMIEVSIEAMENVKNIKILEKMMKFNYADCDELFKWNALKYALENKSFVIVEMILKTLEFSKKELYAYINDYINNDNLIPFCLTHGCSKLLSSILEISEKIRKYFKLNSFFIEHTIQNCYFQEKETLRSVIDTIERKYDFDVDSTNEQGLTALHFAAMYGKLYAVEILLEKEASVNARTNNKETPLNLAVHNKHEQIANLLKESTFKYNLSDRKESVKKAEHFTKKGTSHDDFERNNKFPLHSAAYYGDVKTIESLIDKRAIVDSVSDDHQTPLHIAAFKGNVNAARLLITKGASVDALSYGKETPLHLAAKSGNLPTVELLITEGASVDALNIADQTPLHYAAEGENAEIPKILIKYGASVNVRTKNNLYPLHIAAKFGKAETVALLINSEASIDAVTTNSETALHWAAEKGNSKIVELLIKGGASVKARTVHTLTPLHYAAYSGNSETVALLIQATAEVNDPTIAGQTPLHFAAQNGNRETVALLIRHGASVEDRTKKGLTPLHYAVRDGNLEIARLLIENNSSVDVNSCTNLNETPLHWAAKSENSEIVALLIKKGASVNVLTNDKQTPLHWAAQSGNLETVALLIEEKASVNDCSEDNSTPLHLAATSGNLEVAEFLIEKRASVNASTSEELTPLHLAALNGKLKTSKLLIKKGAFVDARTQFNLTPLHYAAQSGKSKIVALLIEERAEVNVHTTDNETPLHFAAQKGNRKTVELLIKYGASVNDGTNEGQTPLHYAVTYGKFETAKLLIEKHSSVKSCTIFKQTPLHLAAESKHSELVGLLIEHEASVNARDDDDLTPLHLAVKNGNLKAAELLINAGASVHARTNRNLSPLDYAGKNPEMIALLTAKKKSFE